MRQAPPRRSSEPGNGMITFARTPLLGGMTLLRGEGFTGRYRAHLHTTPVIGVVEHGRLGVTVGGVTHLLSPGSILLLDPFQVHEEFSVEPAGWSFRYFFPGSMPFTHRFGAPVVQNAGLARSLVRVHRSLIAERETPSAASETELIDVVRRAVTLAQHQGVPRESPAAVVRVRALLHQASSDGIRLSTLSRVAGMSAYHLVRLFRREIGLPPHAYYEQLRIARSKELLHDQRRLSDVACLVGYSDQSHFTRQFGSAAGVSPGKYAAMVGAPGKRLALPQRARVFNTTSALRAENTTHG